MKFFRNNWYWMLGIVIGLGISGIIVVQRGQLQTNETGNIVPDIADHTPDAIKPSPDAAPGGDWHDSPHAKISIKRRPMRINTDARNNPSLKNLGPIPPITGCFTDPLSPLPDDVQTRLDDLHRKMAVTGTMYEIQNGKKTITEEAHKRRLEVLVGDMEPDDAVVFLETHKIYNSAILNRISLHRAFKYLMEIDASWDKINAYAEKALAENPDDFDAKMRLLLYESDNAKAAEGYREILAKDPNHVGALLNLAYRTHYDDPEGALEHLGKVNKLDPTRGFGDIGLVYERLGDVKTAWLYYRKHETLGHDPLIYAHKRAIERGEPGYPPIHLERQMIPEFDEESLDKGSVAPEQIGVPAAEETPWFPELPPLETLPPEKQPSNKKGQKATRAEAARAEFQRQQAAAQKEFDEFIKWAESIMNADAPLDTNNFLAKELEAHLKGGKTKVAPERLVRAFEMIQRHGETKGFQRLKEKDPELAAEVERFIEEKQQPSHRNNPQNKK
jgi:tetratricopeptide (TPR) repeat protein